MSSPTSQAAFQPGQLADITWMQDFSSSLPLSSRLQEDVARSTLQHGHGSGANLANNTLNSEQGAAGNGDPLHLGGNSSEGAAESEEGVQGDAIGLDVS